MIQFIDLNSSNLEEQNYKTFDGGKCEADSKKSFVHWFDGAQSTGLIYSKPIAFLSDKNTAVVALDSEVFHLADASKFENTETINGFDYVDIYKITHTLGDKSENDQPIKQLTLTGTPVGNKYVYIFYVLGSADENAEYTDEFTIDNDSFIVGMDCYSENESLYINGTNMGIDMPDAIQKAIYPANVHEEKRDNILMNRKMKELISNYWDVIANKGSYKSLLNSLEWFEWGDLVQLREIWKHDDLGKTIYDDRELCSILEDKYKDSLNGFAKTTYLSLYGSLKKIIPGNGLDSETNPILSEISQKWSREDLALKMAMLGNFYETYFMPIHLDLIHATIEDIIYTNTIKIQNGATQSRDDYFYDINALTFDVQDGSEFALSNISVGVSSQTPLGKQYDSTMTYENSIPIFVDELKDVNVLNTDQDLKTLYTQNYAGPGVIIPVTISMKMNQGDFIQRVIVDMPKENKKQETTTFAYPVANEEETEFVCKISCKLLATQPSDEYKIRVACFAASGRAFHGELKVKVVDIINAQIGVYEIQNKEATFDNLGTYDTNFYMFSRFIPVSANSTYKQYLSKSENMINLMNYMIVLPANEVISNAQKETLNRDFISITRNVSDTAVYLVYIARKFGTYTTNTPGWESLIKRSKRADYVYFPEFHNMMEINQDESQENKLLCVIPELADGRTNKRFKFGRAKNIIECEWEFFNVTTQEKFTIQDSTEPFIASNMPNAVLSPGYYDITFVYSLVDEGKHELKLNSAFVI